MQINPYLNFSGQCEAAFKFYEKSYAPAFHFVSDPRTLPIASASNL